MIPTNMIRVVETFRKVGDKVESEMSYEPGVWREVPVFFLTAYPIGIIGVNCPHTGLVRMEVKDVVLPDGSAAWPERKDSPMTELHDILKGLNGEAATSKCQHCGSVDGVEPMPGGAPRNYCGRCGGKVPNPRTRPVDELELALAQRDEARRDFKYWQQACYAALDERNNLRSELAIEKKATDRANEDYGKAVQEIHGLRARVAELDTALKDRTKSLGVLKTELEQLSQELKEPVNQNEPKTAEGGSGRTRHWLVRELSHTEIRDAAFDDLIRLRFVPGVFAPAITVVREVKPITRDKISEVMKKFDVHWSSVEWFLRELGIEVEP